MSVYLVLHGLGLRKIEDEIFVLHVLLKIKVFEDVWIVEIAIERQAVRILYKD